MDEYKFELIGEGYDGFHARRRVTIIFLKTLLNEMCPIASAAQTFFIHKEDMLRTGICVFNG